MIYYFKVPPHLNCVVVTLPCDLSLITIAVLDCF